MMQRLITRTQVRSIGRPQYYRRHADPSSYWTAASSGRCQSSLAATATYDLSVDTFPSIVIGPDKSITPQGPFAEAQAEVRTCICLLATTDGLVLRPALKATSPRIRR